jgi:F-type H+-transporting ATPase subunit delta
MKTPRSRLSRIIADRALKQGVTKSLSRDVAAYLLSERRTHELDSVLRDIQADWAEAGHIEVLAQSAHPLTPAIRNDIERQVRQIYPNAKQISVEEALDPEIVGGVRLSLANQQLDLSVESKLNKFKQLTSAGKD